MGKDRIYHLAVVNQSSANTLSLHGLFFKWSACHYVSTIDSIRGSKWRCMGLRNHLSNTSGCVIHTSIFIVALSTRKPVTLQRMRAWGNPHQSLFGLEIEFPIKGIPHTHCTVCHAVYVLSIRLCSDRRLQIWLSTLIVSELDFYSYNWPIWLKSVSKYRGANLSGVKKVTKIQGTKKKVSAEPGPKLY